MSEAFTTRSVRATLELGRKLAQRLAKGDCVALVGDLGAGKTQLVRGIALGMGLADPRLVSSPTFVLVQEYSGRVPLYHIDLYRMANVEQELLQLGLREMLHNGVVLVEWADRAGDILPRPRWQVTITHTGLRSRRFQIEKLG